MDSVADGEVLGYRVAEHELEETGAQHGRDDARTCSSSSGSVFQMEGGDSMRDRACF